MSADSVHPNGTDTIVLIHGLWVTALSWEHWRARYRARGYRVLAPHWPGMDAGADQLRRDPSAIVGLGVTEIADHYDQIIRGLDPPPVIIGHCLGGLAAQILLDRGLGAAGVAIDPAPATGILKRPLFSMLKAGFPALRNPANRHRAVALTAKQFHYAFTNTLDAQNAAAVYERYHVPGPGRAVYQVSLANLAPQAATRVDFEREKRAPLLLIADGKDHTFPAPVTRSSFTQYRKSNAVTSYREFPGRSHYTIGEPGWEHVADYTLRWAMDNALNGT
jgi:alpha-beta hydrolase superfamily lysophospholipase